MPNINNGVLDGVRRVGPGVREIGVNGGTAGAPLGRRLRGANFSGPPAAGSWKAGDEVSDRNANIWICTASGSPGSWTAAGAGGLPQVQGAAATAGPSMFMTPTNFAAWRAAMARVRTGNGVANVLCMGDSTTEGDFMSNFGQTWPSQFTGMLTAAGIPAAQTWSFWHSVSTGYDTRVTIGSGWTAGTVYGGGYWSSAAGGATLSYAPSSSGNGPSSTDTCTIYYTQATGHGTFTVNVDGGSTLATVNSGTGSGVTLQSVTVTFSAGSSHVINVVTSSSTPCYVVAFNSYLSTADVVRVGNPAIGGSRAADWANTSAPYYAGNWPSVITPDLCVIDLGINDGPTFTTPQYIANMQTIVSNVQATGSSVLLKSMVPSQQGGLAAEEAGYASALPALAQANSVGYLDVFDRWVSYNVSNAYGYYANNEHPSAQGCCDIAQAVFQVLTRV